jgi:HPt (histidine-containing phosphotransfer) domain-containing protein
MINEQKNSEPLDLSYLKDMCGDSAEFIIEMIDLFKAQTPVYIAELEQAVASKDWTKVSASAHKMKPTFVYVGREDARDFMQGIEDNAKALKNLDQLPEDCAEMTAFTEILYKQLDATRAELEKRL